MHTAKRRRHDARSARRAARPALLALLVAAASLGGAERAAKARGGAAPPRPADTVSSVEPSELPALLSLTGLYVRGSTSEVAPENLFYVPQYPLWSDGASKRRWLSLPAGARIDASNPDEWSFPVGTRFWKEFSFAGERTETRYLERAADGTYRYGTYVWDRTLGDARLAPQSGVHGVRALANGAGHDVPSDGECRACHEGRSSPVLGFNALQLSPDRDPRAPHREALTPDAIDLAWLAERDLVSGLPASLVAPRIAAPSPVARAAAGYLYGNCSSCHNRSGPLASLELDFDQSVLDRDGHARLVQSVARGTRNFTLPGEERSSRVVPGKPGQSALWFRVSSRDAATQMPPLGTKLVDREAVRLLRRWILELRHQPLPKEPIE